METTIHLTASEFNREAFDKILQWITDKENADITISIKEYKFEFEDYFNDYKEEEEQFDPSAFMDNTTTSPDSP